eukprot:m.125417 g.125417  ORF g.125417 m.125417 type:complete len:449 (-) comp16652_c0_seq1:60-1406(-)
MAYDGTVQTCNVQALVRAHVASGTLPAELHSSAHSLRDTAVKHLTLDSSRCGRGPWSVTNSTLVAPSGDQHDYVSYGTYEWPCNAECNTTMFKHCGDWWRKPAWWGNKTWPPPCNRTSGLPYIPHDGYGSPYGHYDTECLIAMKEAVQPLALAAWVFQNATFGDAAARVLRVWFLDPATKMNPNLEYSSLQPGAGGSCGGIIATSFRWNVQLYDAVALLANCCCLSHGDNTRKSPWTGSDAEGFAAWTRAYLTWLLTSGKGMAESRSHNNHGTWYSVNTLAQSLLLGNQSLANGLAHDLYNDKPSGLTYQILASGQMPHETARADSVNYCTMNMQGLMALATVSEHTSQGSRLWSWVNATSSTGSIRRALDFLLPFATGEKEWPYSQASGDTSAWLSLAPLLRQAALVYNEPAYEQHIASLPWPAGAWPQQWLGDVSQLLWPNVSLTV